MKKIGLIFIEDAFVGMTLAKFIETIDQKRLGDEFRDISEIQICGHRGAPVGYFVEKEYVIRTGDKAVSFTYRCQKS